MIVLDNSLFDDGSLECFNILVTTKEGFFYTEVETLIKLPIYAKALEVIRQAFSEGKRSIEVKDLGFTTSDGECILQFNLV